MSAMPFGYCALYYLNQWLVHDRVYWTDLAGNDEARKLASLKRVAAFYRVSRNLPERYDVRIGRHRFEPVLRILDRVARDDFQGQHPISAVLDVRDNISRAYGNRGVLSLTTKFLWLKLRHPIILYDSRVRSVLKTRSGDLVEYYSRWRMKYNLHADQIDMACHSLLKVAGYSRDPEVATVGYIKKLSRQRWFKERVF
jgi:hypothetical protein